MPTSNLAMWPAILNMVWRVAPRTVLDVGPGHGKAGILLREYVGCPPIERIDAVEGWDPYITPRMRALYDHVHECDVMLLTEDELEAYELVLMIDVIEHLTKEDGLALLERTPGRVIVCTPENFFQNPEAAAIWTEEHRSLWSVADFGDRVEVNASQLGGVLVCLASLTPDPR